MKNILLVLFILSQSIAFSQNQEDLLNQAYSLNSSELLDKFFKNWKAESNPITEKQYKKLSKTEKYVYDLFYEFYNPGEISKLKVKLEDPNIYKNAKYYIESGTIRYVVLKKKSLEKYSEIFDTVILKKEIKDFRPNIKENDKILFLNDDYTSIFKSFAYGSYKKVGEDKYEKPIFSSDSCSYRRKFLREYIYLMEQPILPESGIITNPAVSEIVFNKNKDLALIIYSYMYKKNMSYYKRENDKWIFIKDVNRGVY